VGAGADSERFAADYGNLLLEVSVRAGEEKHVFEYTVTDKTDGFICWVGSASTFAVAQSDAVLEAQLFLDPYIGSPTPPQWRSSAATETQI
jgi:hypothetical protein